MHDHNHLSSTVLLGVLDQGFAVFVQAQVVAVPVLYQKEGYKDDTDFGLRCDPCDRAKVRSVVMEDVVYTYALLARTQSYGFERRGLKSAQLLYLHPSRTYHIVRIGSAGTAADGDCTIPVPSIGSDHAEEVGTAATQRVRVVGIRAKDPDASDALQRQDS